MWQCLHIAITQYHGHEWQRALRRKGNNERSRACDDAVVEANGALTGRRVGQLVLVVDFEVVRSLRLLDVARLVSQRELAHFRGLVAPRHLEQRQRLRQVDGALRAGR